MAGSYFGKPFKTRLRRQVPNTIALLAMALLIASAAPAYVAEHIPERPAQAAQKSIEPSGNQASSTDQKAGKTERKINIRLSLFRHG